LEQNTSQLGTDGRALAERFTGSGGSWPGHGQLTVHAALAGQSWVDGQPVRCLVKSPSECSGCSWT